jgi:biofilm PGA synthesis N-glycosyltransferase PgaC
MTSFLLAVSESPFYFYAMWFLAGFPVVISIFAINGSRQYLLDRSRLETEYDFTHLPDLEEARKLWPLISVIIPARDEEQVIRRTIRSALELYWPKIEIILIDDGSIDNTAEMIKGFGHHTVIRVLTHDYALGKSISLNEGIAAASSELVLILDGDSRPAQNVLNRMVPHFLRYKDVAAVTGNPRVANATTLLGKLQAIEFTSTISTLRQGQSAWGRVNTISGIMTILRRQVVLDLGGFSPTQPTEDIELTWRLHREGYRCIYEPAAQTAMEVPETLGQWWRQRTRWSSGLVRVLQTYAVPILRKWEWPVFPILAEALAAVLWCHLWVLASIFWIITALYGLPLLGNSIILGHWGTMTAGLALGQIFWGMSLDSRYDKSIWKLWPIAPLYPLFYWSLSAFAVVATTIPTLLTKPSISKWSLSRQERNPSSPDPS